MEITKPRLHSWEINIGGYGRGIYFIARFVSFLLLMLMPAAADDTVLGRISGKFSISASGNSTYQVPIAVPPGIRQVQPELSLTYSSQGANGQAGVGWTLGGLPFIERCGQTVAQDGRTEGVGYDDGDRFCLNGQRLVNISSDGVDSPYYDDGATYHTELESWTSVVGHNENGSPCGSGPCSFSAKTSSGATLEFGASAGSRVLAKGAPGSTVFSSGEKAGSVRIWALTRLIDKNGNTLEAQYTQTPLTVTGDPVAQAQDTGAYYVSRIDYTSNDAASVEAQRSVQVFYEARQDKPVAYQGGAVVQTGARIAATRTCLTAQGSVADQSCSDLQQVSDYQFEYCDGDAGCGDASTTGRTLLSSLVRCDGSGNCLPSTTFGWQTGSNATSYINGTDNGKLDTIYAACADSNGLLTWADFDGNGLQDFICNNAYAQPALGTVRVLLNDGSQLTSPPGAPPSGDISQAADCSGGVVAWNDLNGDSLSDWLCNNLVTGQVKVLLSDGAALNSPYENGTGQIPGTIAACPAPKQMLWADFNGDGRSDWICNDTNAGTFWVMLSNGTNLVSINDPDSHDYLTAQVDYTGRATCPAASSVTWADFNGDGMADWICDDPAVSQTSVFVSTGTGLTSANPDSQSGVLANTHTICDGTQSGDAIRFWADFNGDHLADWICNDFETQGSVKVLLSTSGDLTSISSDVGGALPIADAGLARCQSASGNTVRQLAWTDYNGDGLVDWVCNNLTEGSAQVLLSTGFSFYPIDINPTVPRCVSNSSSTLVLQWFDFNGDGLSDAVCNERQTVSAQGSGKVWVTLHDPGMPDLLARIVDGIGGETEISYEPLTNPEVYTKTASQYPLGQMLGYPDVIVDMPSQVVSGYVLQNSAARNTSDYRYAYSYHYEGGMIGLDGRGWLGFARVSMTDPQIATPETPDGTRLTTHYSQIFPFTGQIEAKIYCDQQEPGKACTSGGSNYLEYRAAYLCQVPGQDPASGDCGTGTPYQPYSGVHQILKISDWQENTSFGSRLEKQYSYNLHGRVVRLANLGDVGNGNSHPVYTCVNYDSDTSSFANWHVGLVADQMQTASDMCPADPSAWTGYSFNKATDLSWTHTDYDEDLNIQSTVQWDDGNGSWLGRSFEYRDGLGNRTNISKVTGASLDALAVVDNSTYDIAYDTTFKSFPATLTTPPVDPGDSGTRLSAQLAFDARFGTRIGIYDLNDHVQTVCLDGFGRSLATQGPNAAGGGSDLNCLAASAYGYLPSVFGAAEVVTLTGTEMQSAAAGEISIVRQQRQSWENSWTEAQKIKATSFVDGLARAYKKVVDGEAADRVTLTEYRGQKKVARTSFPFFDGTPESEIQWSVNTYDVYGRPASRTVPYNGSGPVQAAETRCTGDDPQTTTTTCYAYSAPNSVLVTRAANTSIADQKRVEFDYFNALKRPVAMTGDGTTTYGFDLLGRPVSVVDAGGVRSEIAYDSLGRRVFLGEIDLGPRIFTYDSIGRLAEQRDGIETRVQFAYDGLNRLLSKSYFGKDAAEPSKQITFTYDNSAGVGLNNVVGRKATASLVDLIAPDRSSTYQFGYAPSGQSNAQNLLFENETYQARHTFNAAGRLSGTELPDPHQTLLRFTYRDSGLLSSVDLLDQANADPETYLGFDAFTAAGQPQRQVFHNGVVEAYDFSATGDLKSHTVTSSAGSGSTLLLSDAYVWNPLGLTTAILDCNFNNNPASECDGVRGTGDMADNSQSFSYVSNRLTTAEGLYGAKDYQYAPGGNLIRKDNVAYTYESQREDRQGAPSHQVASSSAGLSTRYDGNGNMIAKITGSGAWQLTYDMLNKLVAAELDGVRTNDYVYDYTGRRLKKVTYGADGQTVTDTAYYISPLVEATTFGGGTNRQYTRYVPGLSGKAIAITSASEPMPADNVPAGVPVADTSLSLHRNAVASTVLATDAQGAFYSQVNYTPYGGIHNIVPGFSSDHYRSKFDGHELDGGSEIYDFNARYYDQDIARFRSADRQLGANPLSQDAFNRYELNLSDPISLTDPTGRIASKWCGLAGGAFGAVLGAAGGGAFDAAFSPKTDSNTVNAGLAAGEVAIGGFFGAASGYGFGKSICDDWFKSDGNGNQADGQNPANDDPGGDVGVEPDVIEGPAGGDREIADPELSDEEADEIAAQLNYRGGKAENPADEDGYYADVESCSFVADTLVLTSTGTPRTIASLTPGARVLGQGLMSGRPGLYGASRTHSRQALSYFEVKIGDETVRVTRGHRFKILNGDWTRVEDLEPGDLIRDIKGEGQPFVSRTKIDEPAIVHSMTVDTARNYHVTRTGLLVHNCPFNAKEQPDELGDVSDIGGMAEETGDVASITGEAATDTAAIGEATAVAAEGATDVVEGAAAVAGGAEVGSDIVEGLVALCIALCWL